jgi:hypothetical protein
MSNNIYNILGKLASLTPVQQDEKKSEEIYESVEPKGSILEGVAKLEQKLADQLKAVKEASINIPGASMPTGPFDNSHWLDITGSKDKNFKVAKPGHELDGQTVQVIAYSKNGKSVVVTFNGKRYNVSPADLERRSTGQTVETKDTNSEITAEASYVHKGTYGTEYQGDSDDEEEVQRQADTGTRKRGRPAKGGKKVVKKNPTGQRGRPKKSDSEKSMAHLPWGGKPPKVDANPTKKWPKDKTTVHKMESKLTQRMIGESRLFDDAGETLDHILSRFKAEVKEFEQTGELDNDLYYALFDYYHDRGDIPYGTAKGRDGDPMEWVSNQLDQELAELEEGADPDFPTALRANRLTPQSAKVSGYFGKYRVGNRIFNDIETAQKEAELKKLPIEHVEESIVDEELNELAKLAGLHVEEELTDEGNEFSGALAKAKAAGSKEFEVGGKKFKVEESCGNMSPFSGASSMDADNLNINTSYNSKDGSKSITISAEGDTAEQLAQMLKLSGLAGNTTSQPEVKIVGGSADEQVEEEYSNEPNEQVATVDAITNQGNDLNRQKKQFADKPKLGDNPMAVKESEFNPLDSLGRKLLQAYESIKISK